MRKISLFAGVFFGFLSVQVSADTVDTAKFYFDKYTSDNNVHLEDVDFKSVYPKKFYNKSYFGAAVTGVVIVGAGAFTYFTAGAGAPVAATGASTVATWVAGGGAGSYMAGLSTIGGWFGGNAILGASILNGISIGVIGGGSATFVAMPALSKVGVMTSVTASSLDGVFYFSNPKTDKLEYKVRLTIPKDLGSKDTRKVVDRIYAVTEEINEAYADKDANRTKRLFELKVDYHEEAIELLRVQLDETDNQEDLFVLGIIGWNNNEYDLFNRAISKIDVSELGNTGFLNYMYALQSISKGDVESTLVYLDNSFDENKYAIEPNLLYINVLGNNDFSKNEAKIERIISRSEASYDSDKYASQYNMVSLYYRVGTFYFVNRRYVKAQQYYQKAFDGLSLMEKYYPSNELKHIVQLGIANSLYKQKKTQASDNMYQSIVDDIDEEDLKELDLINAQYLGLSN